MPSDAKKREQQRKKEAAKARQTGKKQIIKSEDKQNSEPQVNGDSQPQQNGAGLSVEGLYINAIESCRKIC